MFKAQPVPSPEFSERIKTLRAEIDEIINGHVEEVKAKTPGVPAQVIRQTITGRVGLCECRQYEEIFGGRE